MLDIGEIRLPVYHLTSIIRVSDCWSYGMMTLEEKPARRVAGEYRS